MVANLAGKPDVRACCVVSCPRSAYLNSQRFHPAERSARVETYPGGPEDKDENKARVLIEKKTAINLVEAFAVAVKHYLRGEDGIYYTDLYHLVKFLPAYALPNSMDSSTPQGSILPPINETSSPTSSPLLQRLTSITSGRMNGATSSLPMPVTSSAEKGALLPSSERGTSSFRRATASSRGTVPSPRAATHLRLQSDEDTIMNEEDFLLPARLPPKYHLFDLFPFSLLIHCLEREGKPVKGQKAARMRAKMSDSSENLPLELSLYLVSCLFD